MHPSPFWSTTINTNGPTPGKHKKNSSGLRHPSPSISQDKLSRLEPEPLNPNEKEIRSAKTMEDKVFIMLGVNWFENNSVMQSIRAGNGDCIRKITRFVQTKHYSVFIILIYTPTFQRFLVLLSLSSPLTFLIL